MNVKRKPSYKLTFEDAIIVWKRYRIGETQMRIASYFDTNIGRVSEVLNGKRHPGSEQASLAVG